MSLLRGALRDEEWAVRYAAAESLNSIASGGKGDQDIAVGSVFRTAIKNSEWAIRYAAAEALGRSGGDDPVSLSLLRDAMRDHVKYVRMAAADAMNHIGRYDADSLSLLKKMIVDNYWNARRAAVEALGRAAICDLESISLLCCALKDGDLHVCRSAAIALKHMASSISEADVIKALVDSTAPEMIKDYVSDSAIDVDIVHGIHLALLRVHPVNILRFLSSNNDYMKNETIQIILIYSMWLHGDSFTAYLSDDGPNFFLNKCPLAFEAPPSELKEFIDRLVEAEKKMFLSLRSNEKDIEKCECDALNCFCSKTYSGVFDSSGSMYDLLYGLKKPFIFQRRPEQKPIMKSVT